MATYNNYVEKVQKMADVGNSISLMSWDQETYMPKGGEALRSRQIATLAGILHEMKTADDYGDILQQLSNDKSLDFKQKRNIEESLKSYKKAKKFTTDFVVKRARTSSECFQAWVKARKANDFSIYQPYLEKMVALKREETEILGYDDHPYTALLDQFEPGMTTTEVDELFADVKKELKGFVQQIFNAQQVEDNWLYKKYDTKVQWDFGMDLLRDIGYDLHHGRQDVSAHPFTTGFGSHDIRVTTRLDENDFQEMCWGTLHEGGHALYEQGLPINEYGLPSGNAISLGIHESQSRLYENNLGRGIDFWRKHYPKLQQLFPDNLKDVSLEDFYKSFNMVKPSLIRTSADELTYHFHIMIRFEIEKALIEGSLEVADIPKVWNAKYKEYLNIDVPSDADGCLQDVHWSHGSFGYFPTYSIGSFYAAQFYQKACQSVAGLQQKIAEGSNSELLSWLRTNIHQYGMTYAANEICERATGERLNFKYFMDYAREKYAFIYGLN